MLPADRSSSCAVALLGAFLLVAGCGQVDSDDAPGKPEAWSLSPQPLTEVGRADGDEPYLFSRIRDVELMDDGSLLVADGASNTIRLFDAGGAFVRQMGRAGEGPGEFEYIASLEVRGDTIVAYDSDLYRLTRLLTDGTLVSTTPFGSDSGPVLYLGRYANGDHALAWIKLHYERDRSVLTPDFMEVGRFDDSGRRLGTVAEDVGMRRLASPVPFSPHFIYAMIGDSVVISDGIGPIQVVAGPGVSRTIDPQLTPLPITEARARLESVTKADELEDLREIFATPGTDTVPAFSEMFADDAGRLWLKSYEPTTDSHRLGRPRTGGEWVVINRSGRELARVTVPSGFRLAGVEGDRAFGVARDELGIERVRVYALARGG